jgi:pilus assembly protein CpaF
MNTGHEGGCGTIHANSAADVPARIEALGMAAGLTQSAAHSQLASAVQLVAHLQRGRDGVRRLAELAVLTKDTNGLVCTATAVRFSADGRAAEGPGAGRLAALLERR